MPVVDVPICDPAGVAFELVLRRGFGRGDRMLLDAGVDLRLDDHDVSARRRRIMLHCIAKAWRVSNVPFVLVGTPALASLIRSDRDRVGIYEVFALPAGRLDGDFLDLLHAWDEALALKRTSGLADRELAMHLFALSEGRLSVLAAILTKAAAAAIVTGQERITVTLLDEIGYEVPSSFSGFLF